VPVVLVFTQFDLVVSQVLVDIASGDPQHAIDEAQDMYKESRRRLLHKHPRLRDVPTVVVSSTYSSYIRCVEGLVDTIGWL
jgi:hypothetical protein